MLTAIRSLIGKDLIISRRNPVFVIIGVLVPVFFVLLYSFIVQTATTAPIAIAQESHGPVAQRFVDIMRMDSTPDGPTWEIRTTDPAKAEQMYANGDVIGVLRIPASFDADVAAGRASTQLEVQNINSDITKNLNLRIEKAIGKLLAELDPAHQITFDKQTHWPTDPSFTRYMGASLLMFAIIYAAMVNTGNLIAREWEENTAKALVLSPKGFWPFVVGKWTTALIQTVFTTALVLLMEWAVLDYPVWRLGPNTWVPLLLFLLYGSALGVLLGVALKRSLPLVPVAAVIALVHFLLVGFESYMRGYAYGGLVEFLWQTTRWWPVAGATDQVRFGVEGLTPVHTLPGYLLWLSGIVVVLTAIAITVLRKRLSFKQGQ